MAEARSDLAAEIVKMRKLSENDGVFTEEYTSDGIGITKVRITTEDAEQKTGKPRGTYVTAEISGAFSSDETFTRAACAVADEIRRLAGDGLSRKAMVIGLGNDSLTADALGPLTARSVIVTRHLKNNLPDVFSSLPLRETSIFIPDVLGRTGTESAETIKAVVSAVKPDFIIIIDALASRRTDRLCATVQISDTGICPGSGVGNARCGINEKSVGIPVISVGIPTVVDALTLAVDLLEEKTGGSVTAKELKTIMEEDPSAEKMIVTPRDIDVIVRKSARLLSVAINKALHGDLDEEEINALMG